MLTDVNPLVFVALGIAITVLLATEAPKIGGPFLAIVLLLMIANFEGWKKGK